MNTGGVLALDLSRTVGWAYGHPGDDPPLFGFTRLQDKDYGKTEAERYDRFHNWIKATVMEFDPEKLVIEAPLPLPAHTTLMVTAQQLTLRGIARMEGWRNSSALFEVDVGTVRSDILGRRWFPKDAVKDEVVRYCRRKGWKVPDHNAGDACLLWLWHTRRTLGIRPVVGPLFAETVT